MGNASEVRPMEKSIEPLVRGRPRGEAQPNTQGPSGGAGRLDPVSSSLPPTPGGGSQWRVQPCLPRAPDPGPGLVQPGLDLRVSKKGRAGGGKRAGFFEDEQRLQAWVGPLDSPNNQNRLPSRCGPSEAVGGVAETSDLFSPWPLGALFSF